MLFTNSFYDAVDGLRPADSGVPFVNAAGEAIEYAGPPVFERRLGKVDSPPAREAAYIAKRTEQPFKVTFPAASWFCEPQVIPPGQAIPGYNSPEEAREHCMQILRELVLETIEQGANYIQFDFPSYPLFVDDAWSARLQGMGVDLDALLEQSLDADRRIIADLPAEVHYGLHLCRGNWRSRWLFSGSLEPLAERIFGLPYDTFLVEWEDTTREGDYAALRHVPRRADRCHGHRVEQVERRRNRRRGPRPDGRGRALTRPRSAGAGPAVRIRLGRRRQRPRRVHAVAQARTDRARRGASLGPGLRRTAPLRVLGELSAVSAASKPLRPRTDREDPEE